MDGGHNVKNENRNVNELMEIVQYIPFFNAIGVDGGYEKLGLNRFEFDDVLNTLNDRTNVKRDHIEKQLQALRVEMTFLGSSIYILKKNYNFEIIQLLGKRGINIEVELLEIITATAKKYHNLYTKYKMVDSLKPKKKKVETEVSGYDIIASLSASLEYRLPMDMCVAEYISHYNIAKRKNEQNNNKKRRYGK